MRPSSHISTHQTSPLNDVTSTDALQQSLQPPGNVGNVPFTCLISNIYFIAKIVMVCFQITGSKIVAEMKKMSTYLHNIHWIHRGLLI